MTSPAFSVTRESEVESLLAGKLAAADRALTDARLILRRRLTSEDDRLFNDRTVAKVRAQIDDLAGQLAGADAASDEAETFAGKLITEPLLTRHVHALAIEAQLADTLAERVALDPVASPLLQAQIASPDSAETAKKLLAAQTRFLQTQRRGELRLAELPREIQDALAGGAGAGATASRLALLERVVAGLKTRNLALDVTQAGVALFATALAGAAGIERDAVLLATFEAEAPRLAVALRAAGLGSGAIERQLLALLPDTAPPEGLATLSSERAAALLAGAQ